MTVNIFLEFSIEAFVSRTLALNAGATIISDFSWINVLRDSLRQRISAYHLN